MGNGIPLRFASSRSGAKHKSSGRLPDFQHPCIHPLSKVLQNHPFTLSQVFHNQPEILLRTQKLLNMLGCWPTGGGKGKKQLHVTSPFWNFYCWAMCIRIYTLYIHIHVMFVDMIWYDEIYVCTKPRDRAKLFHPSEIEAGSQQLTDLPLCQNKSSLVYQLAKLKGLAGGGI